MAAMEAESRNELAASRVAFNPDMVLSEFSSISGRLEDRIDELAKRVERVEQSRSGNSQADMTERVMLWFGIAYLVSLLLPPLIQLLKGSEQE